MTATDMVVSGDQQPVDPITKWSRLGIAMAALAVLALALYGVYELAVLHLADTNAIVTKLIDQCVK